MKPPAFPFYVKDWLAGTRRLSLAAKGVYVDLLAWSWDNGPLPRSVAEIARIVSATDNETRPIWRQLRGRQFRKSTGGYVNPRLERERGKSKAFAKLQAEKARRSWRVRRCRGNAAADAGADAGGMLALALAPADQDQDQDQGARAPDAPAKSINPLTKIAHVVLDDVGRGTVPARDAIDELKLRAARARIPYDGTVITKAIRSAEVQRAGVPPGKGA